MGLGFIVGESGETKFELCPSYNMIFTDEESTKYFAINLGVIF